jgi:hypothetical protein
VLVPGDAGSSGSPASTAIERIKCTETTPRVDINTKDDASGLKMLRERRHQVSAAAESAQALA